MYKIDQSITDFFAVTVLRMRIFSNIKVYMKTFEAVATRAAVSAKRVLFSMCVLLSIRVLLLIRVMLSISVLQSIRVRSQTRIFIKPFLCTNPDQTKVLVIYSHQSLINKFSCLQDWAGSVFRAAECRPQGPKRRGVPWWGRGPSSRAELILRREIPWPVDSEICTERFIYILARIYISESQLIG